MLIFFFRKSADIKFGKATRNYQNKTILFNPGPGTYAIPSDIGRESPSYSLSPKRENNITRVKGKVPGPGSYNPDSSFSLRAPPNCKFGSGQRISVDLSKTQIPSPLEYIPKEDMISNKRNAPAFGFGTSRRPDLSRNKESPGPGNYSIPSKIKEGPGYQMGVRIRDKRLSESPSPGQYSPTYESVKTSMPKFGMGSSSRYNQKINLIPGPGAYDIKIEDPKFKLFKYGKFGSDSRYKIHKNNIPGPGAYRIPTKIVEAPRYLMPKIDETFAYV